MRTSADRGMLRWIADSSHAKVPRGAALRATARRRLRRAGVVLAAHGDVLVDQRRRTVWRTTASDGSTVYVKADGDPLRLCRESLALTAAAEAGVPTPPIRLVVPGRPGVLVLGEVAGEPLRLSGPAAWQRAGAVLRRLHAAEPPEELAESTGSDWWGRAREQAEVAAGGLVERGLLPRGVAQRIARRLDSTFASMPPLVGRFLHGDCMAKHILVGSSGVNGVIDWADAGAGDPLWDVAVVSQFVPQHLPALIDGYQPAPLDGERMAEMLPAYWTLRHMRAASWTLDHGYDPGPHLTALAAAS